jgi:glycosyltransferase involved in cell wall biosynthesis
VGGFNPHKNLVRCAEAFARLVRARPDRELHWLVIGDYEHDPFHTDVEGLRAALRRWGLDGRVHLPGFVPDEALRRLYAGALALLLPSLEEGFGLPALEAAACGTPCVATRRSPLPQLLEKGGLFVDPEDTGEMATALARIGGDPGLRASLAQGALAAAAERSWSETAERTRAALHAAVGLRR